MGKKKKISLLFTVFIILLLFLIRLSSPNSLPKRLILNISSLPYKFLRLTFVPIESIIYCHSSLRELSYLKEENKKDKILLMQLKDAAKENNRLRDLLSFKERSEFSLVAAEVIASDVSNLRRTLVINRGSRHNIAPGNSVIVSDGLVGMVVEVSSSSSRIILINDPDFSIAAYVQSSDVTAIVSGSLEGLCKFKYLESNDDVRIGDQVVSAGRNSRFPPGIPIGKIISISKDHSGVTLFAIVNPAIRLSSLKEVLVIVGD
ncbi:rod shape-determining protein MreC [Thermoproteota archaeon]